MKNNKKIEKLKLVSKDFYIGLEKYDPIRFYYWPIIGRMYRQRVEYCLAECKEGERVLDIGFGSGVNFLNLNELYGEIHGLDLTANIDEITAKFQDVDIPVILKNGDVLSMPFKEDFFDTVLLVSILEHLKPEELPLAIKEIRRVLKPGGQMIFGIPFETPFMVFMFRLLGVNIREHHFSTQEDILKSAQQVLEEVSVFDMRGIWPFSFPVYRVGHFMKEV